MDDKVFAEVVLDLPGPELGRVFDYGVSGELRDAVRPGSVVEVPFGAKTARGWVVAVKDTTDVPPGKLREIADVLSECGTLATQDIQLARWAAREYCAPLRDVLQLFLPPGLLSGEGQGFRASSDATLETPTKSLIRSERQREVYEALMATSGAVTSTELRSRFGQAGLQAARSLVRRGLAEVVSKQRDQVRAKTVVVYELAKTREECAAAIEAWGARAPQRAATLRLIASEEGPIGQADLRRLGGSASSVRDLVKLGFLKAGEMREWRTPDVMEESRSRPTLNGEQGAAVAEIVAALSASSHSVFLLHGVTGSGKTEVYLTAVQAAIDSGRSALILVPEIALTPQTSARFKARFGDRVAILHSRLSSGERFDEWERVASGEADIVLGARSAVFAPLRNLGLVVVDEEHEGSYKQEDSPRYHAVEVAIERARLAGGIVVLGSATPSIESYHRAETGAYRLLSMHTRATGGMLPAVAVVDMREELATGNRGMFSRSLHEAIGGRLVRGEQVILFLNRRGYARVVLCRACGITLECPHCGVALTLHASGNRLQCHYCDYSRRVPDKCPQCGSGYIRHFGVGTERVEEEVRRMFPGARAVRMDVDTTRRKGAHQEILEAFRRSDHDILIGTQMVAKGLDFANVTLVGVIAADTGLRLPDYRAAERTFQLLAQVAGRAGRGRRPGEVVVQTYSPEHYAITAAARHDYRRFYDQELAFRRSLGYPPFGEIVVVTASGVREEEALGAGEELARAVSSSITGGVAVLGPVPAPIARLRGRYRFQVILKGGLPAGWQEALLETVRSVGQGRQSVALQVSVRPQSLL